MDKGGTNHLTMRFSQNQGNAYKTFSSCNTYKWQSMLVLDNFEFLANQTPHAMFNGRAIYFLVTLFKHQILRASSMEFPNHTFFIPIIPYTSFQIYFVKEQNMIRCEFASSSCLHKQHYPRLEMSLLCKISHVRVFLFNNNHMTIYILMGI